MSSLGPSFSEPSRRGVLTHSLACLVVTTVSRLRSASPTAQGNSARAIAAYEQVAPSHLDDLKRLGRIPSVSSDPAHAADVRRCVKDVAELLARRGFDQVRELSVPGAPPYILAETRPVPGAPTVLCYAHGDVQAAGMWSQAFEPTERDRRLYIRGGPDDKAGILLHAAAVDAWQRGTGGPPLNVKFLIEFEEEVGSPHLKEFLATHRDLLEADLIVPTDTGNIETGVPSVTTSLRGLVAVVVRLTGMDHDLHSGQWGGPVPDPALGLCKLLSALQSEDGRILVPGLYEDVAPLDEETRRALARLPVTAERFREQAGLLPGVPLLGDKSPCEMTWYQPSLAINALEASSLAEKRNVINASAAARVGLRLAPGMDPGKSERALVAAIQRAAPRGFRVDVEVESAVAPWSTNTSHPAFAALFRALEKGYQREATTIGCGGSIGFVAPFVEALGAPALLIGVEDPYSNAHSANESLSLADFDHAIRSVIFLYEELATALRR